MKTTELLLNFVNQKPGLDKADYPTSQDYNRVSKEITQDRTEFLELFALASIRLGEDFERKLKFNLQNTNGRLSMLDDGSLEYVAGQYFPTEYRPAASRILAQLIWNDYRDEQEANSPNPLYKTGDEMRKALRLRGVSNRVMRNYFN